MFVSLFKVAFPVIFFTIIYGYLSTVFFLLFSNIWLVHLVLGRSVGHFLLDFHSDAHGIFILSIICTCQNQCIFSLMVFKFWTATPSETFFSLSVLKNVNARILPPGENPFAVKNK
jgi:hypothetical protein